MTECVVWLAAKIVNQEDMQPIGSPFTSNNLTNL